MDVENLLLAYRSQKCSAARRGIDFILTFEEWLQWWVDTGKLHLRGKKKGSYQMCRHGDIGPYSLENIYCDTVSNNSAIPTKGKPVSPERTAKAVATRKANHPGDPFKEYRIELAKESEEKAMAAIQWAYETRTARRHALKQFNVSQRIWERCLPRWESMTGLTYDVPKKACGDANGKKKHIKPVQSPFGKYPSAREASIATGISQSTIVYRCMNKTKGWSYATI